MIWRRIPHHFVLAVAFGVIALGVAAAIIEWAAGVCSDNDATIRYASSERQGLASIARADVVLHDLLRYRALVAQPGARRAAAPRQLGAAITHAIEAIGDTAAGQALDPADADQLATVRERWRLTVSQTDISADDVSAVIRLLPPLLAGISGSSGLTNDPSTDGINFSDALLRFPAALVLGSEAAATAMMRMADHDADLPQRFATARLLAQAQTAIDVGLQDGDDELAVDPAAARPLNGLAARTMRDFAALKYHVTDAYVESSDLHGTAGNRLRTGRVIAAFDASSLMMVDALQTNLLRVTGERIDRAQYARWRAVVSAIGGVTIDIAVMSTLAWFSIASSRNARRRMAAETAVLESQRSALEVQLTNAKAQQALLHTKAQFRAVFDGAPTGLLIVDRAGSVLDENEAARSMLTVNDEHVTLEAIMADAPSIDRILDGTCELYEREHRLADRNGAGCWFHVSISPIVDETGAAPFAIVMLRDITESKNLEAQLLFDAGHDALTGLPNRKLFLMLLQEALDSRDGSPDDDAFSVVFIDFNDFKTINDSFGHQAGDSFLVEGAARLRDSVRSSDVVARIGGDEFAILLHGIDRADIEKHVTRLQSVISIPVNIEGQLVASSASFGIAQADRRYTLAPEIIRDADTAMYQAKADGGRKYVVFDTSMRDRVVRRMQLSIDIVRALEHDEMELYYQPIVDLRDGRICGCEALIRWHRSDGALILPSEFMPLAEENGAVIEIGHWVTATACRQMEAWNASARRRALPGLHDDFVMHVNLAVPEVHHVDLLTTLQRALDKTSVRRQQIILEITEGVILKNTPHVRSTLEALTRDGFRLCIDDFGTGYSSLRYLNELPLHCFKIDRSFVSNGSGDLANTSIVEMLMVLSRSLELSVVAEGIETPAQWHRLRSLGCRFGQGYLFAPPLDGLQFTGMLERDMPLADPVVAIESVSFSI